MWATMKYVSLAWMSIGIEPRYTPESPPITNIDTKPSANSMGVLKWIRPSHSVASQLNTLMPVGMAMSIVVAIIGMRSQGDIPETNMWCAQTEKPRTRMAISESAMRRYPKTGFRAKTAITSEAIPNPGSIMMYTAGWE